MAQLKILAPAKSCLGDPPKGERKWKDEVWLLERWGVQGGRGCWRKESRLFSAEFDERALEDEAEEEE